MMNPAQCPRCRAPLAAQTPFCAHCGLSLAPGAPAPGYAPPAAYGAPQTPYGGPPPGAPPPPAAFGGMPPGAAGVPGAGFAPMAGGFGAYGAAVAGYGVAPMAYAGASPGVGPSWPYPEVAQRTTSSFDAIFGWAFIASGIFCVFIGGIVLWAAGPEPTSMLVLLALAITFPAIGIKTLRVAAKNKRNAVELAQSGMRCWGRILSAAPGNMTRSVGGLTWVRMKITVEAFAAPDPRPSGSYRQHAAGSRVAERVEIDWFVSMMQTGLLIPGNYCALLLDPNDPSRVHLDGLATAQGQIMPLT